MCLPVRKRLREAHSTFVEQEVSFLYNVFVEGIFRFPSDSVIDLPAVHQVREDLFLILRKGGAMVDNKAKHTHTNTQAHTHKIQ